MLAWIQLCTRNWIAVTLFLIRSHTRQTFGYAVTSTLLKASATKLGTFAPVWPLGPNSCDYWKSGLHHFGEIQKCQYNIFFLRFKSNKKFSTSIILVGWILHSILIPTSSIKVLEYKEHISSVPIQVIQNVLLITSFKICICQTIHHHHFSKHTLLRLEC
jgi:hypothetical protein